MRRVAVIGVSGAGKSTLARTIAAVLAAPYVELDRFRHLPGWREAPDDDFRAAVAEATNGEAWVVDGNYEAALGDLVWGRVDTFVWLDLPLATVLARLVKRIAVDLVTHRDLFNGNRQTLRAAFWGRDALVAYAIRHHAIRRREWPDKLARFPAARVVRLRSAREVDAFVAAQRSTSGLAPSEPLTMRSE